ncbi:hypothetical protein MAP00_008184 [Monascus purpureus]|nr:hypothetical protein MAP00_008184 [Monascus purpureus]
MVTCTDCENYHLCLACLLKDKHGHHPAHTFTLVHDRQFCLKSLVLSRCQPGRHHQHAAICDGCDKRIIGVRHKCLTCPDWDYCVECVPNAPQSHPGHRFIPIYQAISEPPQHYEVHYGIFCDGPLCKDSRLPGYITGTRYKCSVCHDVDFCAKCEALPTNTHNRTHPLIKFNTPVRSVSVSTIGDDGHGGHVTLGDRVHKSTSSEAPAPVISKETYIEIADDMQREKSEEVKVADKATPVPSEQVMTAELPSSKQELGNHAVFVRETIPDGTKLPPNEVFQQTWTLHNPGPSPWPAGCVVRFVGGDSMLNVNTNQPSSLGSIKSAMESDALSAPVEPGQNADFTVTLKTPNREGIAISYWRLKLPDSTPFGDRLWCDVQVRADSEHVKEKEKEPVAASATEVVQSERNDSAMIFPLLEKESPVASTHEEMARELPSAPTVSSASEKDVLEDVENLTLDDADTEDGFLTDDEYDILDASDQEFLDAKQV